MTEIDCCYRCSAPAYLILTREVPVTVADAVGALDVEIACTRTDVAGVEPEWSELWSRIHPRSPFLSSVWHAAWWATLGEGAPEVVVLRRNGAVAALAPLARRLDGVLEFSGGEFTDALDVLAVDDEAARQLGTAVAARARTARVELSWIPSGGRALGPFAAGLRQAGFEVTLSELVRSPRLTLAATFEEQLAALSRKNRHELRRKLRRLERAGAVSFAFASEDEREDALARFAKWHRAAPGEKGAFLTAEREAFFRELARVGGRAGWCRIGELRLAGRPIASLFAFEIDGVLSAYNSAVDPPATRMSPGVLLHALAIRDAIERGVGAYDFLRGDERYKYDLGAVDAPLYRLRAEAIA